MTVKNTNEEPDEEKHRARSCTARASVPKEFEAWQVDAFWLPGSSPDPSLLGFYGGSII